MYSCYNSMVCDTNQESLTSDQAGTVMYGIHSIFSTKEAIKVLIFDQNSSLKLSTAKLVKVLSRTVNTDCKVNIKI